MIYKTLHRKPKVEQHEKPGMTENKQTKTQKNVGAPEVYADLHVIKPKQNLITNILYTYIVQADIQRP